VRYVAAPSADVPAERRAAIGLSFLGLAWWPGGQHDGLGVPLIAADGRPVGLLILLTDATGHPSDTGCQVIGQVAQMIAAAIDPMTSIIGLAGLVVDARASAVVGPGCSVPTARVTAASAARHRLPGGRHRLGSPADPPEPHRLPVPLPGARP
jgi:GAF domain-containing protein